VILFHPKEGLFMRPNVLWIMSDQHNANCTGYAGHPNVRTPHLDRIAARGVNFTNAFSNNPICSPSRISFITGQYCHTHQFLGNDNSEYSEPNPDTLACQFRRYGYQTAITGKSHMIRRWDSDGFEFIRYTDLADATALDPEDTHYFKYLVEHDLADLYEDGTPKAGQDYTLDGSAPAMLPYEHSIEHYTGSQTLAFLEDRDENRPFFIQMSFQRPHSPIAPAREHFDMYDPDEMVLPESAFDYFENQFAGKPAFMQEMLAEPRLYPLADPDPDRLRRVLASYYALITAIDSEIGRVLDWLAEAGELENTIILYTADHGDFAGEHGLFHKNLGIYESIHRIPFVLSWPGGPRGEACDEIVESVDWYPTICGLCDVPVPEGREGVDLVPIAAGQVPGKEAAFSEWHWMNPRGKISAVRTDNFRLVFYEGTEEGELYDRRNDPGETRNLWDDPDYAPQKTHLLERLFRFTLGYATKTSLARDRKLGHQKRYSPTTLLHKRRRYWSGLLDAYESETVWPPVPGDNETT
jgi:arylsulfatase A-like enzyme